MPRSNRPRRAGRPARGPGGSRSGSEPAPGPGVPAARVVERAPDGDWVVQHLSGSSTAKSYRCPGCNGEIPAGTAHLVAWRDEPPLAGLGGVEDRRHWHTPCWRSRARQLPGRERNG